MDWDDFMKAHRKDQLIAWLKIILPVLLWISITGAIQCYYKPDITLQELIKWFPDYIRLTVRV